MALKFSFNKLRTSVLGFLGATDSDGTSLAAGEEAVHVPKMRLGFYVESVNGAIKLIEVDSV